MGISITQKGDWSKTFTFLDKASNINYSSILNSIGQMGVQALANATPKRSGVTAASWTYTVRATSSGATIEWQNTNTNGGYNIALLIQYGHGTGWGGYVAPIDYINPAIDGVYKQAIEQVWKEVISA